MATNLALAPPACDVDGLHATPIDIQHIAAKLTFDASTQASTGDATLQFTMSAENGCPVFDLRQTITGVWLDGAAVPLSQVAPHDFGGGQDAHMLVLAKPLAAGSSHSMRVTYSLGMPQSPPAGSYQPGLSWSAGPRLRFNFGFTDLGPGRYLDAWVPANLIFDQYDLSLELELLNTTIAHTLITNGTVTTIGANHWLAAFPASITAFSPLIELHAADVVTGQTGSVVLPGGAVVTIEVWKAVGSNIDLGAEIADLSAYLLANATSVGPQRFGNRFVVYFAGGGMEYDGGTTAAPGTLKHETYHSWWGRGIKPSSQNDGWLDEAWTEYITDNLPPLAFNVADPPVQLCSQNPWVRITPYTAYGPGSRLFQGIASLTGAPQLGSAMASWYQSSPSRPFTTLEAEGHLVSQLGREELVDAFHRWVYGFQNHAAAGPDLWMRDDPGHGGAESWAGRFWDSPDLWIRHADDGGLTHENPIAGRDNWFYARVRNRGVEKARHFMVTFNVKPFAGTEFVYPGDFLPAIAATGGFELQPGQSAVVKALWPAALVPAADGDHCLLASVHAQNNHPVGGRHVWEENALAQKNLTIVSLFQGGFVIVPVVIGNWKTAARSVVLELRRPAAFPKIRTSLLIPDPRLKLPTLANADASRDCGDGDRGISRSGVVMGESVPQEHVLFGSTAIAFADGTTSRWTVAAVNGFPIRVGLRLQMPPGVARKGSIIVDLVQLGAEGKPVGGIAVMLTTG